MSEIQKNHAPYHQLLKRLRDGDISLKVAMLEATDLPPATVDPVVHDPLDGNYSSWLNLEADVWNTFREIGGTYDERMQFLQLCVDNKQ